MSVFEVILVRIFPALSRVRTEYGEIRSICPNSVRMRENAEKMWTIITPNTDTFYAVSKCGREYKKVFRGEESIVRLKNLGFITSIEEYQKIYNYACSQDFRLKNLDRF